MKTKLNKIILAVSFMLAMAFTFSFSQEVVRLAEPPEKPVTYDKVHNLNPDSLTVALLKESQAFYSSSFNWLLGIMTIIITTLAVGLAFFNRKNEKNLVEKIKYEMKSEFEIIKNKFKEEVEMSLKNDKEINQEKFDDSSRKFDDSFRFISRIHRRQADKYLGKKSLLDPRPTLFHEFFYYMYIFYKCLTNIESLNDYDLNRLTQTAELFLEKMDKKSIKMDTPQENKDNIIWFIIHLLKFANKCNKNKRNEYSNIAKSTYRALFNLLGLIPRPSGAA